VAHAITPTDVEAFFDKDDIIVSKTDVKGRITYANQTFCQIAGYSEAELMGQPHSIIRHPDMPRAVFKLLWDQILAGREVALRWRASVDPRSQLAALCALGACAFAYLHLWDARTPAMVQSRHVAELADELRPHFRGAERLLRHDAPRGLFSQLGRFEPPIGADALHARLADPSHATWLAVVDETGIAAPLRPLLRRPFGVDATITVMSDRDALPVAQPRPPRPWPGLACFALGLAACAAFAVHKTLAVLRASAP